MPFYIQLFFLFITLSFVSCSSKQWVEVVPEDGAFSISMPASPTKEETEKDFPSMRVKMVDYYFTTNEITYFLGFSDYPPALVAAKTTDMVLDLGIQKCFANASPIARKESSKTILSGFPARSFNIYDPRTGYSIAGKSCLVGFRVYVLQVINPSRINAKRETERFFESFQIEKKMIKVPKEETNFPLFATPPANSKN